MRHVLSQALGSTSALKPGIQVLDLKREDYVLLCTDGLTDVVENQDLLATILECRGDPQIACDHLVGLANERGGKDDITAVLLFEENWQTH